MEVIFFLENVTVHIIFFDLVIRVIISRFVYVEHTADIKLADLLGRHRSRKAVENMGQMS